MIQLPSRVQSESKNLQSQQLIEVLQQTPQGMGRLKIHNPSEGEQRLTLVFNHVGNDAQGYAFFSSGIFMTCNSELFF